MEAKTLTPDADADPAAAAQTLAAGELVWAKPSKLRRHCWWPARVLAACPATVSAARDAKVFYFGEPAASGAPPAPPAQVRRFAGPDADAMARGSTARGFLAAVEVAHARAVAALRAELTCACVPPPPHGEEGGTVVGVTNLAPAEFLAALHEAALGVCASPVGLVDRTRLKSWARAFGEGWGPDGAQHYPRRPLEELVDKIDLDVPAGEDRDADDWLAEDEHMPLKRPQETPVQKKRSVTTVLAELDEGENEDKSDSPGPETSGKRERKKSKYLSPPYTNLGVVVLPRKPVDSPKASVPKAAEDDSKVLPLPDSIVVEDVLLLVRGSGKDPHHRGIFPEAAEEFLGLFRSSAFVEGADYSSYKTHECPVVHLLRNASMDIAPDLVSDSHAVLEQDKRVTKRGRKKDGDGSGGSSIKRKKRDKTSPAAALGSGIPITPAIPIRQVKAEDMRTLMKAGSSARGIVQDEKSKPSLSKCPISATVHGAPKPGHEQVQENDKSVMEKPPAVGNTLPEETAKDNDEAKLEATKSESNVQNVIVGVPVRSVQTEATESEANICIDVNAQSVVADVPVGSVSKEATEPEASVHRDKNVQGDVADGLERSVSKEATESNADISIDENMQSAVAGVPDRSVSKEATKLEANVHIDENLRGAVTDAPIGSGPSPMHEDMAQPIDENKEPGSVEVRTVQQSYASLQAMLPEMLKKEENTNGSDVITMNHALKDECQKDEAPVRKVKLPAGAASNHSSGEVVNGTCPDPANFTPNKKKKKTAQHFESPAAILLDFRPGVIVPSREELLSVFGMYGYLIESQTEIVKAARNARVVFGKNTEAEEAYNNQQYLGQFGPPFATLRLDYLPPIKLSVPSPSPSPSPLPSLPSKPPLTDIRKNLEKMIAARHSALNKATSSDGLYPVADKLLGDMQGLLSKVDKMLSKPSANNTP